MKPKAKEPRDTQLVVMLTKTERRLVERVVAWENEGRKKHRLRPLTMSDMTRALFFQRAREVGVVEEGLTPDEIRRKHQTKRELARRARKKAARPPYDHVVRTKSEMSFFAEWEAIIKGTHPELSPGIPEAAGIGLEEGPTDEEEEAGDEEGSEASGGGTEEEG